MEQVAAPLRSQEVWAGRRRRARHLAGGYPFAGELLRLYEGLLDPQERAFRSALDDRPDPATLSDYLAEHVVAAVADATVAAGPAALGAAVRERLREGDPAGIVAAWLAGDPQDPVDEYLARASAGPVLEALGPAAGAACARPAEDGGCPRCGGRPQVSYLMEAGEALVSGPRMLQCHRCGESWIHARMTCAACGEQATAQLPIFADAERLPHLRADACQTCRRYVITIDLRKDAEAIPIVDELIALPLDLDMRERGFAKIVPNLMAIG